MSTKIAAVQMCSSMSLDENLQKAKELITEASKNQAKLVVLPEMFTLMGKTERSKLDIKEPYGKGKVQSFLSALALEHNIWIVSGTIPLECDNKDKIKAACLIFNDQGQCVARYDKVHLFDVVLSQEEIYKESDTTEAGDHLTLIDSPFGKLGIAICYDLRFPELFRSLFNKGAEILIVPSAFTETTGRAHWEILARSRAIENFCYFIGSCQGGKHANGRSTFGHSLIINPWGTVLAKKEDQEPGVIYADIDLMALKKARESIPIQNHQRIFVDDRF